MSQFLRNQYFDSNNLSGEYISSKDQNFLYFPTEKQQLQENAFSILHNFWPTTKGPIMRGGCRKICTLDSNSSIISAFSYRSSTQQRVFLANHREIYDVTDASSMQSATVCVCRE
ncbi:hypothetical protein Q7M76_05110 [Candidatus Liberibacter asiaticus]|uniref:Uncharacterized protein n=2 Tax=Liberibacter asiaticus TaxID=34021 RepID=C6XGV6_LIBAP|nr:hypothetical protein [Candidatus Liberibacter asiaticus]ACT57609.1 hypothetical protein CLIBASIA_05190 [Candidatus Liberibacter asiaticus str. psy62]AGH17373.1 hypothetical protein WSI_05045 [Candidatus Liberibacter asiaticus str. gxpsy]ALK07655.1 hypothetical protein CD16_05090 [Candidatus Liberibacter asiaticus]ASK53147.1 hypothetical protein B2I23_05155 [Candidatus Liberibacter asiaticus]AWL14468.1 hypothetical protein DIC79_05180 [Candidatus Liberibacter asiaticus]